MLKTLGAALLMVGMAGAAGLAQEALPAKDLDFSFEGPFGTYDQAQLQRGFKVYKEVCASCHSLNYIAFRNLGDEGGPRFSKEQVTSLSSTYTVRDGPDANGEMFDRPALPSDRFPAPFPNEEAARAANGGALPPDLTLMTKARAGWYGTIKQFVSGLGGPEYVYSLLTGYQDPPAELASEQPEGRYYNPYFVNGHWIAMPPPLNDGQVTFDDGTPNTVGDMARDVAAFLAWTAEPKLEMRKATGFSVMIYLAVLAVLLFLVKQKVWRGVAH